MLIKIILFQLFRFFPEDEFVSNDSGIYVNSNMAYYYNIEVGDILELEINVPYAMLELNNQETLTLDDNIEAKAYNPVSCLGDRVPYKGKVLVLLIQIHNLIMKFIFIIVLWKR